MNKRRFKQMNPDLKQRWLKALRGGGYRQTSGKLRYKQNPQDRPEYCCLGVLANIAGYKWECDDDQYMQFFLEGTAEGAELPKDVLNHVGLSSAAQNHLIAMNDGGDVRSKNDNVVAEYDPRPFSKIADWIEENL